MRNLKLIQLLLVLIFLTSIPFSFSADQASAQDSLSLHDDHQFSLISQGQSNKLSEAKKNDDKRAMAKPSHSECSELTARHLYIATHQIYKITNRSVFDLLNQLNI